MAVVSFPTTVVIERPVVEVFQYMCDVTRMAEWIPFAKGVRLLNGADPGEVSVDGFGRGARILINYGFGPIPFALVSSRVVEFVPGRSLSLRADMVEGGATYTLRHAPEGTVLSALHETWGFGFGEWIRPWGHELATRSLWSIKQRVELSDPGEPEPLVFFSYRRAEMEYSGGRIFSILQQEFGPGRVFRDIDSIPGGARFAERIGTVIGGCPVTLAVIGAGWLDEIQRREEEKAEDWVRAELAGALDSDATVIPVLVGAELPAASELPSDLAPLTECNAIAIRPDPDFDGDVERLILSVRRALKGRLV